MSYNSGGMPIGGQFAISSPVPLDCRYVVTSANELTALINEGGVYDGLEVWFTQSITYNSVTYSAGKHLLLSDGTIKCLYKKPSAGATSLIEDLDSNSTEASAGHFLTQITITDGKITGQKTASNAATADKVNKDLTYGSKTYNGSSAQSIVLDDFGITATAAELNTLDGITATTDELNVLHGSSVTTTDLTKLHNVTASDTELNVLDGVTANTTELNYVKGVTSAIQTQLDGKALKPVTNNTSTEYYVILGGDSTSLKYSSTNAVKVKPDEGKLLAKKFSASSDARLKENFQDLNTGNILELPVFKFDFIDGPKNQIGCKAQDLQKICPEIVDVDSNGYLSIQESKLVYLLLQEVKKLKQELNNLKNN